MLTRAVWPSPFKLAAIALAALYFAVMSGHLHSIDGLLIYRQGEAFAYEHSLFFSKPIWPGAAWLTSKYGIGLSLLYVPSLLLTSWLHPYIPMFGVKPYDWALYYTDPYYAWAAAPVHVVVTVMSAYLVALVCKELGLSRSLSLCALALYGLGSPAIIYARGDWGQQLEGLCWITAIYGALRFRHTGRSGALLCGFALTYALLTRPLEGVMISLATLVLMVSGADIGRWPASQWRGLIVASMGLCAGFGVTLLVNQLRYGSSFIFGYENEGWTTPISVGLVGSTISPARGILWEFPAVLLAPLGVQWLLQSAQRKTALLMAGLVIAQLLNVSAWMWWWGGWNFGLRLFVPALPLLAVLAACGLVRLPTAARNRVLLISIGGGLLFSIPCILTDLAAGYGDAYNGTAESLQFDGYPLLSAFKYLDRLVALGPLDRHGIDILWLRLAGETGGLSLVPMALLLLLAGGITRRLFLAQASTDRRSSPPVKLNGPEIISLPGTVATLEEGRSR
ncbi:MAG: hypothetical protein M3014_12745 [Chloroflexota bacterium]|nr:hypothetical protein [Chloroflexota bacterium]